MLSLGNCSRCLVVDDQLTVLPISSQTLNISAVSKGDVAENDQNLIDLKASLSETQPVSALLNCCKTLDQVSVNI